MVHKLGGRGEPHNSTNIGDFGIVIEQTGGEAHSAHNIPFKTVLLRLLIQLGRIATYATRLPKPHLTAP